MSHLRSLSENPPTSKPSPLMICDRLLTLAEDAERAGFSMTADHLVHLAYSVFEEPRRLHA